MCVGDGLIIQEIIGWALPDSVQIIVLSTKASPADVIGPISCKGSPGFFAPTTPQQRTSEQNSREKTCFILDRTP
eukprot:9897009-Heterocapsa_arctica.AAC.1